jgi:hypothetical protein
MVDRDLALTRRFRRANRVASVEARVRRGHIFEVGLFSFVFQWHPPPGSQRASNHVVPINIPTLRLSRRRNSRFHRASHSSIVPFSTNTKSTLVVDQRTHTKEERTGLATTFSLF